MARKKREQPMPMLQQQPKCIIPAYTEQAEKPLYSVGIYARLSEEDARKVAGHTLQNQIDMLTRYTDEHPELHLYSVYADNNRSGTSFDKRPEFGRLMEDIRRKRVNCVLVKDLSRFGRNYIEVWEYVIGLFPHIGVRFIALCDGYDSLQKGETPEFQIKNIVNEFYARNVAVSGKASKERLHREGAFTGQAPYGYRKSETKRFSLEIDLATADNVRLIYRLAEMGLGKRAIAKELNRRGIPSPGAYRRQKDNEKGNASEGEPLWSKGSVGRILENPVYEGAVVHGRFSRSCFDDVGRVGRPLNEWIRVENRHEAIITPETAQRVRARRESRVNKSKPLNGDGKSPPQSENVLRGLLFCGSCHHAAAAKKRRLADGSYRTYLRCSFSAEHGRERCIGASVSEPQLLTAVEMVLRRQMELAGGNAELLAASSDQRQARALRQTVCERQRCLARQRQFAARFAFLYEQMAMGRLSEGQYRAEKERAARELELTELKLAQLADGCDADSLPLNCPDKNGSAQGGVVRLTAKLAALLIKRIDLLPDRRVAITLGFYDELCCPPPKTNCRGEETGLVHCG